MLYHSFETQFLLSFFYLPGKLFVKIGSRFQYPFSFYFIEISDPLDPAYSILLNVPTPPLIRTPLTPFIRDPRVLCILKIVFLTGHLKSSNGF